MPKRQLTDGRGKAPLANGYAALKPRIREIAVSLIDEPPAAMRETMDEVKLVELTESIRSHGLIQPLAVREKGKRFETLAGHRRLLVVRALGWATVLGSVYPEDFKAGAAIKAAENRFREDVNPAEESTWLWNVLETECGGDVLTLCDSLHMRQDYVEARLNLRRGDVFVFAALAKGEVGVGVAQELNLVKDPARRAMYLQAAIEGGASARLVKQWRTQGNAIDELQPQPAIGESGPHPTGPAYPVQQIKCELCELGPEAGGIETLFVHRQCRRILQRLMERIQQDAGAGAGGAS